MPDLTIKEVPLGCEQLIKNVAMQVIDRFIRQRDLKLDNTIVEKCQSDIDDVREANSLNRMYEKKQEVIDGRVV